MRNSRYASVAIGLHWLIALALLFQIALGWRMDDHSHSAQTYLVFQLHKSVGITILLLSLVRLGWRLSHPPPPLPQHLQTWERWLATATHVGFYVILIGLPLTGWLVVSASKTQIPTLLYGTVPWPHLPGLAHASAATKGVWRLVGETGHGMLAKLTYVLLALHVAGALKHQLLDRDETLSRMIPGLRPGAWFDPRGLVLAVTVVLAFLSGRQIFSNVTSPAPVVRQAPPVVSAADLAPTPPPAAPATPASGQQQPQLKTTPDNWTVNAGGHLRFATSWSGQPVAGEFHRWTAKVRFGPDALESSSVEVTIDPTSIDTGDAQRDATLPTEDWLKTSTFPKAVFRADHFRKAGAGYIASGRLTLRGETHPVRLEFNLQIEGDRAKASGHTVLDRTLYGVGQGEYAGVDQIPANVDVTFDLTAHKSAAH